VVQIVLLIVFLVQSCYHSPTFAVSVGQAGIGRVHHNGVGRGILLDNLRGPIYARFFSKATPTPARASQGVSGGALKPSFHRSTSYPLVRRRDGSNVSSRITYSRR